MPCSKKAKRHGCVLVQALPVPKRGSIVGMSVWGRQGPLRCALLKPLTAPNRRPSCRDCVRASPSGSRPLSEACLEAFGLAERTFDQALVSAAVTKADPRQRCSCIGQPVE
jgi:hypothetical protein